MGKSELSGPRVRMTWVKLAWQTCCLKMMILVREKSKKIKKKSLLACLLPVLRLTLLSWNLFRFHELLYGRGNSWKVLSKVLKQAELIFLFLMLASCLWITMSCTQMSGWGGGGRWGEKHFFEKRYNLHDQVEKMCLFARIQVYFQWCQLQEVVQSKAEVPNPWASDWYQSMACQGPWKRGEEREGCGGWVSKVSSVFTATPHCLHYCWTLCLLSDQWWN